MGSGEACGDSGEVARQGAGIQEVARRWRNLGSGRGAPGRWQRRRVGAGLDPAVGRLAGRWEEGEAHGGGDGCGWESRRVGRGGERGLFFR